LNTAKEQKKNRKWEKAMGRRVKFLLLKAPKQKKETTRKTINNKKNNKNNNKRAMPDRAIHFD
jgi:hypothetical protein